MKRTEIDANAMGIFLTAVHMPPSRDQLTELMSFGEPVPVEQHAIKRFYFACAAQGLVKATLGDYLKQHSTWIARSAP